MTENKNNGMKVVWFILTPVMLLTGYFSRDMLIFWMIGLLITAIVTALSGN